jgi:hypothetical protein
VTGSRRAHLAASEGFDQIHGCVPLKNKEKYRENSEPFLLDFRAIACAERIFW